MPSSKSIRDKISSVESTQKITKAMQLVAASKIRKAQEKMEASQPYAEKVLNVIKHVALSHSEYHHPYLQVRAAVNSVGYIVVSSDRGLCGGLNSNLFRTLLAEEVSKWGEHGVAIELCLLGTKAETFFKHIDLKVISHANHLGDVPLMSDLIGPIKVMLDHYQEGKLDRLFIVFNEFVNTMTQKVKVQQLLPLVVESEKDIKTRHWDYIYEPDNKKLLDTLLVRYIESQVYQGVIDNIACEQAARMVAMKSATDNAGEIIKDLQLIYNNARQSAITQEISEIIGGAEAV